MPHLSRIEGKNICYYISTEGYRGKKIFRDDNDRLYFISLLRHQKIKSKLIFYAYVLLKDKYAFLMETTKNNLMQSMHEINSNYANFYNRCHNSRNRLFKDRYNYFIIDKDKHLAEVSCYIHLLPQKITSEKKLFRYKWSSYPGYVDPQKRQDWIDCSCILDKFKGEHKDSSLNYKEYISQSIKKRFPSPFRNARSTALLGSNDFIKKTAKKAKQKESAGRKKEIALARKIIRLVKKNTSWTTVFARNAAIYFIKKYTYLNNQEISTLFNPLSKSSVGQLSLRFRIAMQNKFIEQTAKELEIQIKELYIS